jgi:hypothetical protein
MTTPDLWMAYTQTEMKAVQFQELLREYYTHYLRQNRPPLPLKLLGTLFDGLATCSCYAIDGRIGVHILKRGFHDFIPQEGSLFKPK